MNGVGGIGSHSATPSTWAAATAASRAPSLASDLGEIDTSEMFLPNEAAPPPAPKSWWRRGLSAIGRGCRAVWRAICRPFVAIGRAIAARLGARQRERLEAAVARLRAGARRAVDAMTRWAYHWRVHSLIEQARHESRGHERALAATASWPQAARESFWNAWSAAQREREAYCDQVRSRAQAEVDAQRSQRTTQLGGSPNPYGR